MELSHLFTMLGALFLIGLVADQLGRRTRLPRVTLLIGFGILIGPSVLDLLPSIEAAWYEFMAVTALTMVAFLLGGSLTRDKLFRNGRVILTISMGVVVATLLIVTIGLTAMGVPLALSLILAAIATATAPAATQDVILQSGYQGDFVDTIKGIVAIDDAWGLLVFSVILVMAGNMIGAGSHGLLLHAVEEIGLSILIGLVIGGAGSFLTSRLQPGEPIQSEALGLVFLCAGVSMWLGGSFLIAGMTAGCLVANLSRDPDRAFDEIEHMQWPFIMLFFILAGASLEMHELADLGMIGLALVVLRIVSRQIGAWVGAKMGGATEVESPWYGIALLPQAGVATGMALIAAKQFPELADVVLTLTIASTIVFELIGPAGTLFALNKVAAHPESGLTRRADLDIA